MKKYLVDVHWVGVVEAYSKKDAESEAIDKLKEEGYFDIEEIKKKKVIE